MAPDGSTGAGSAGGTSGNAATSSSPDDPRESTDPQADAPGNNKDGKNVDRPKTYCN